MPGRAPARAVRERAAATAVRARRRAATAVARVRGPAARLGRSAGYLAGGFPIGQVWLIVAALAATVGLATALLLVGLPLLALAALSGIAVGAVERARLRWFTGTPVPSPHTPVTGGPFAWARRRLTEPATWWELAYAVFHCLLSFADFVLVIGGLSLSAALLAAPYCAAWPRTANCAPRSSVPPRTYKPWH
ncbi:sensor domain-containing protein [Streptomyces sp. MST-110588]|uniref:sensor domain-containing protein n=1 Tax=Streptomyces sp. MST-110588 TaxID=2833628 RepID=UPI001F5E1569|nr:sensor domain-containing protein [Streptomyces sp. MST-110588]UNO38543.1 sensor domain-containing protein [Streptomyces sp. MST-110588]